MRVELNYLISQLLTGVSHLQGYPGPINGKPGVFKFRVRFTMAKGPKWLTLHEHVCKTLGDVVDILRWHLRIRGINGVGELASGIDFTKEHFGNGAPSLPARPPSLQDGGHMFLCPGNAERAGTHLNEYGLRIRRNHRLQQLLLVARKV